MTETDKGTNARLKLEITEVSEPKDIGKERPWMMLEFKAKLEGEEKSHTYKAFNEKFFEHIKKGETVDCDINITSKTVEGKDGPHTYTNRKVTQIYVDGQPVNIKQSGGYRGGGNYQADPAKLASEELRSRMHAIKDCWIGKVLMDDDPEVTLFRKWCIGEGQVSPPGPSPKTVVPKEADMDAVSKLLSYVIEAKALRKESTARQWLTNVAKIEPERIDSEPEKVLEEIKLFFA